MANEIDFCKGENFGCLRPSHEVVLWLIEDTKKRNQVESFGNTNDRWPVYLNLFFTLVLCGWWPIISFRQTAIYIGSTALFVLSFLFILNSGLFIHVTIIWRYKSSGERPCRVRRYFSSILWTTVFITFKIDSTIFESVFIKMIFSLFSRCKIHLMN